VSPAGGGLRGVDVSILLISASIAATTPVIKGFTAIKKV
jgi:hypothetical protein